MKGLGEAPLPLFAAADAREASFSPEGLEPDVSLRPLTEGREVVEDYRALQLSLRAHPLAFLRQDLIGKKCAPQGTRLGAAGDFAREHFDCDRCGAYSPDRARRDVDPIGSFSRERGKSGCSFTLTPGAVQR